MNENTAHLKTQIRHHLQPAKNKGFYLCPLCGSGQGKHQTGALHLCPDNLHVKCFACDFYGDIFDLVAAEYHLDGPAAFQKTKELLGAAPALPRAPLQKRLTPSLSSSTYLATCAAALPHCAAATLYLQERGFTPAALQQFGFGYDEKTRQLVIPYGPHGPYYIRRSLGPEKHYFKPPSAEAGPEPLFLGASLAAGGCVYVVESQLCALSIVQVGGAAVALGGGGTTKLLSALQGAGPGLVLALSLDNDQGGEATATALGEKLTAAGIPFLSVNVAGTHKDPNEALQQEPEAFAQRVHNGAAAALAYLEKVATEEEETYRNSTSAAGQTPAFLQALALAAQKTPRTTGFAGLDHTLGGGLHTGLYILGALSSLGKTTFALQLADQMAAAGHDVLFFSLEMSRAELMAKSLSRVSRQLAGGENANTLTTREVISGHWAGQPAVAQPILAQYARWAGRLFFHEGGPNMTVTTLRCAVEKHVALCHTAPVVVVDYLQIMAPLEARATDKQNTDRAVFELKRLSRDFDLPVLAISSLNRENYTARLSMSAFKESGAIEYSSDVLLGLQFRLPPGAEKLAPEVLEGLKQAEPREVELKLLKNRNGPSGAGLAFCYLPRYNLFYEEGRGEEKRR